MPSGGRIASIPQPTRQRVSFRDTEGAGERPGESDEAGTAASVALRRSPVVLVAPPALRA